MSGDLFSVCVEIFGYIASLLVVFSLTRTSVKRLWTVNAFGCLGFIIFALITHSYPTALMNFGALVIDLVQLYRLGRIRISFELVPATRTSDYYKWFVKKHIDGILSLDPERKYRDAENLLYYVRDNEVAGLLAYNQDKYTAEIMLDYVTPKFRDCKIGQYFFGNENHYFFDAGISTFIAHSNNPSHDSFLQQMGFSKNQDGVWEKKLHRE
jgi:hypothetical protein